MKIIIAFLIASFFSIAAIAQTSNFSQFSRYQEFSTNTAFSESVNHSYLFLADDYEQQVVFNPARALSTESSPSFVSFTVHPNSNTNIHLAGLLPAKSGKWFYSFGGKIYTVNRIRGNSNIQSNYNTNQYDNSSQIQTDYRLQGNENSIDITDGQIEFRLLKIFGEPQQRSHALGFIGGFAHNKQFRSNSSWSERNTLIEAFRSDTLIQRNINIDSTTQKNETFDSNHQLLFGVEYYGWDDENDSRHRLLIQLNMYRFNSLNWNESNNFSSSEYYDPQQFRNRSIKNERTYQMTNEVKPLQIRYDGYKNFQLNWLGNDFWIINADAEYGFGSSNHIFKDQSISTETDYNGNETTENDDLIREYNDADDYSLTGRLSTGYAIKFSNSDYSVFTGFQPYYEYSRMKSAGLEEFRAIYRGTFHNAGIRFPLFVSYNILDNLNLWGGSNFSYTFDYDKTEESVYPDAEHLDNSVIEVPVKTSNIDESIGSSQRLYFGLVYEHSSGIGVVANTRGNLAGFSNWLLTLRYSY